MEEDIKVSSIESEEFYQDFGEITDEKLRNFKPDNNEHGLRYQTQTFETLEKRIKLLEGHIKSLAYDEIYLPPDNFFIDGSLDFEKISISRAISKLHYALFKIKQRLDKEGL